VKELVAAMNLRAAERGQMSGAVSLALHYLAEVRSYRKFIIWLVYYQIFVCLTNSNRGKPRGIKPELPNKNYKPFKWTKSATDIINSINKAKTAYSN
jgi:hypothetical protein